MKKKEDLKHRQSSSAKTGQISDNELRKLKNLYSKNGTAVYGSAKNLQKASGLPKDKVVQFLQKTAAHTKYGPFRKKFRRLKVIAYDINEIWSADLAYVDKLAKYNNGVKYLLVSVDVLSRYLRVEPLKSKDAAETKRAFKRMIKNKRPKKLWTDKGTEFKGVFKSFCDDQGIEVYHTESETKSAFAERNIRSLKNMIYKHLEYNWSWKYIDRLDDFVKTINSRVNRVTKLAPNKVQKKDVKNLVSLIAKQAASQLRKPKYKKGDFVRIAKPNLPFKKGYKQTYTDEVFEIATITTWNPPTYNLVDATGQSILGKFYELELKKVGDINDEDD